MLRRLFNTVADTALQPIESIMYSRSLKKTETLPFSWLITSAPCFPVNAKNIKIISDPKDYYSYLLENCKQAKQRIMLVSLYLGNGEMEGKLIEGLRSNQNFRTGELKINVLLDYTRGSRFKNNSRYMLKPLLQDNVNCTISLYHTPELRGILKRYVPDRWNELFGLQHMKLYIFDDTVLISGANLSNDYFTNRQDRYFMVKDKRLTDFYCGLVSRVEKFCLKMDKTDNISLNDDWHWLPYEGNKREFVEKASSIIRQYIAEQMEEIVFRETQENDTLIFPTIQMGQLGIQQDSYITDKILAEAPRGSKLKIATGYFNLTNEYKSTLVEKSNAKCDILMAHPEANGFLGAQGLAGAIPFAYSLLARKFKTYLEEMGQKNRINLFEYLRNDWTFHGKGLWYYPPGSNCPCLTMIGSPNFGERSVKKDLETQLVIVTENHDLQKRLHEECEQLYQLGLSAETERSVPKWIHIFLRLFRTYF